MLSYILLAIVCATATYKLLDIIAAALDRVYPIK